AMWMILLVAPLQAVVGDAHGLNTLEHQPAKIAAIEGHWENKPGEATPLILFGIPDMDAEKTRFSLEVPYLGSLVLTHSLEKQIPALKSFAKEDRPNSTIVFWSFRVMAGLGMLMILSALTALWLRRKGKLYDTKLFHRFVLLMGPSGLIALL
ncbi:cytochrome ubiquinol oxidase subunit I, partial [Vibrio parahaemolyticus]|uniref:cytochrome ubiquinol oxidase subunit I n=1 Tax=Vibrio parahaemolyticus TaxID=670 RepID=UPI001EEB5183|nr:cytochrome ubiquinol oxidase subunit I [Vibrio parahaemolyticus]